MAWHFQNPGFFRVLIHHYLPIYYLQTHLKILFLDGHDLNWSCPKARFGLLAFTVRWKYRNIFIGLLSKANFDVKYMNRAVKVKNMKKVLFLSSVHNCFDVLPREDLSILQLLFNLDQQKKSFWTPYQLFWFEFSISSLLYIML